MNYCELHDYSLDGCRITRKTQVPASIYQETENCSEICKQNIIAYLNALKENQDEIVRDNIEEINRIDFSVCKIHNYGELNFNNLEIPPTVWKTTSKCDEQCRKNRFQLLSKIKNYIEEFVKNI